MTFDEIVTVITDRLNLTSSVATTRIGKEVNKYYKRVTTALGIAQISRVTLAASVAVTIGSAEVAFTSCEKVSRVWYLSGTDKVFLDEVTFDELRDENPATNDTPGRWAQKSLAGTTVTVLIDTLPESAYALKADVVSTMSTLSGSNVPAFPESFHFILTEGVLKDEYKKLEKTELAKESRGEYEQGLSDLKMWVAKSKYLLLRQGERPRGAKRIKDNLI